MNANCLVTKLKGVVDNNNLKKLGVLKISVNTNYSALKLIVKSSVEQKVKVIEGKVTMSGKDFDEFTLPANTLYNIYSNSYPKIVLEFTDKYSILELSSKGDTYFDLDDLVYSANLNSIDCPYDHNTITGNLSSIENKTLINKLDIRNSYVIGDISSLSDLTNLMILAIGGCKEISGDIEVLGALTNLTRLSIGGTKVAGTLESFVKSQVSNGRTSGSITMGFLKFSNVTFNGIKPNDSEATLTWVPNSTDSTKTDVSYNGVTITIDDKGNKVE